MITQLKVFVYGTLKPGESNYPLYCAGKTLQETRAYTWGQLFHLSLRQYPAMTQGNSKVSGFLLTFADASVLETLDHLEDYLPQRSPEENEYQRQKIMTYKPSGEPLDEAWGYVMTFEKVKELGGVLLPSGWWGGIL